MASVVGSEVEIQDVGDVQIQEVEIEPIPVEMPVETVETTGEEMIEIQPMIALQPLPEAQEEIILQTTEEVVGDPSLVYTDSIPIPSLALSTEDYGTGKRGPRGKKRPLRTTAPRGSEYLQTDLVLDPTGPRKWEQKQVQIKTLEGEFSVTMWASGKIALMLKFVVNFYIN